MNRTFCSLILILTLWLTPPAAFAKLGVSLGADLGLSAGTKSDLSCTSDLREEANHFYACVSATESENRFPEVATGVMPTVGYLVCSHGEKDSLEVKCSHMNNPYTTLLISLVPGLALHGAGHYYIGEKNTAYLLSGVEVVSVVTYTSALAAGLGNFLGGSSDEAGRSSEIVMGISAAVFVGTWLYDVVGAQVVLSHKRHQYGGAVEIMRRGETTYAILSFPMQGM